MDKPMYGVFYPGGASGQFIKSILVYMLSNDTNNIDFADGTSHAYYRKYLYTLPDKLSFYLSSKARNEHEKFEYVGKFDSKKYTCLVDSSPLNVSLDIAKEHGIDFKLIFIYVDEKDWYTASANHFYKQPAISQNFVLLSAKLFNITDLKLLTNIQLQELINHESVVNVYRYLNEQMDEYVTNLPDAYKSNVYKMNFYDIMNNPDKVIGGLENITKSKMSESALQQYQRYIHRQELFKMEKNINVYK